MGAWIGVGWWVWRVAGLCRVRNAHRVTAVDSDASRPRYARSSSGVPRLPSGGDESGLRQRSRRSVLFRPSLSWLSSGIVWMFWRRGAGAGGGGERRQRTGVRRKPHRPRSEGSKGTARHVVGEVRLRERRVRGQRLPERGAVLEAVAGEGEAGQRGVLAQREAECHAALRAHLVARRVELGEARAVREGLGEARAAEHRARAEHARAAPERRPDVRAPGCSPTLHRPAGPRPPAGRPWGGAWARRAGGDSGRLSSCR